MHFRWSFSVLIPLLLIVASVAEEQKQPEPGNAPTQTSAAEGHSIHGEVFNEGPRQAAVLMEGVGRVQFPVTTVSEEGRKFFVQGVAQLHGFWYFESERSFRQAAMLDPGCAMAYWGMAMSNRSNARRAKGFSQEAMKRKEQVSQREQLYIEAFDRFIHAKHEEDDEKTKRAETYITDLENLICEFPEDLEAKAFLCEFLWSSRKETKLTSYLPVDAMIQDILDSEPLHPAHHYRIHLWDTKKSERALESAARCGLAAPAIAHMWHMPGHTYSKLHRYHDAVWQQEASARVDHAHMMRYGILPDQIHNFAHNNEWCIRNMVKIGRVQDAIRLAQNMISLPQHPKYNRIDKSGSFQYGRKRLREVLLAFGMFDELIRLSETVWLESSGDETDDLARSRSLGIALTATGGIGAAQDIRAALQETLDTESTKKRTAGDAAEKKARDSKKDDKEATKARQDAEKKPQERIAALQKAIDEIDGRLAMQAGQYDKAAELLKKADDVRVEDLVSLHLLAGHEKEALQAAQNDVKANPGEFLPLAVQTDVLFRIGRHEEAKASFMDLQKVSSAADPDIPISHRMTEIARSLGMSTEWKLPRDVPSDIGARPTLDTLGPFRWKPISAKPSTLVDSDGKSRSLNDYRGQPVVVIFYLGSGCLHCVEQLTAFSKRHDEFKNAGLQVVAVSTDRQTHLKRAITDVDGGFPFPLLADPELTVFRDYRCVDDFERMALHGTFLIDANGMVRWQDISFEPFTDLNFLLKEADRLMKLEALSPSADSGEIVHATTSR
jgi:peroxiredoxin/tetratricopeptide (TPR) repeat protein